MNSVIRVPGDGSDAKLKIWGLVPRQVLGISDFLMPHIPCFVQKIAVSSQPGSASLLVAWFSIPLAIFG